MRTLAFAIAASAPFLVGAAHAANPNVPPSSPYALVESGPVYYPPSDEPPFVPERRRRLAIDPNHLPNYARATAPPPGLMFDQPSTIGGYPIGY